MVTLIQSGRMAFDGAVGDLGSKPENVTTYEMALVGMDVEAMKTHLQDQARIKGVEFLTFTPIQSRNDGKFRVGALVRSLKGIV